MILTGMAYYTYIWADFQAELSIRLTGLAISMIRDLCVAHLMFLKNEITPINGWTKVCPEFELLKPDKARPPDKLLSTH